MLALFCCAGTLSAQTEPQLHPANLGAYGASSGDIPTVATPSTAGHTHITRAALATAITPNITLAGDVTGAANANTIANSAVTMPKIAQAGATTGQVIKWNGTAWAPATDAGTTYTAGTGIDITGTTVSNTGDLSNTNELQTVSRNVATNNIVTLSNAGGTVNVEDLFVEGTATFTAGQTTATMTGTLPAENAKLWVYRNGVRYVVGASGCSGCNVTRTGSTLTFARSITSGEVITFKHPLQ